MRVRAAMATVAVLAVAGCGPVTGRVAHGRLGSFAPVEDASFGGGRSTAIADVVAPGDGFGLWEAVGAVRSASPGQATAVVWTSPDGARWSRVDLDPGSGRAGDARAAAGARRLGRSVVVGTVTSPAGDRDGRIWTSTDGAAWTAADVDPSVLGGPGDQEVTGVDAGPFGFVATGVDRDGTREVPAVWRSADGQAWSRVAAGPDSPFLDGQVIGGVAVGGAGVVAVGTTDTGGDVDAMVWFSPDGTAWRTVPLGSAGFTGPARQAADAVTATAGGFVAVGADADADRTLAVAWTSPDGITWARQPPSPDMGEVPGGDSTAGVTAQDVAGAGPVVAVGGGYAVQVWTSADGTRWTRDTPLATRSHSEGTKLATDGRSLLLLNGATLWFRPAGGSWTGVAGDPSLFPQAAPADMAAVVSSHGRLVAIGSAVGMPGVGASGDDAAAVWTSTDAGRSWTRGDAAGALGDGSAVALTTYGGLVVAVGSAFTPAGPADAVAAVWTSADDGDTWRRVDPTGPSFAVQSVTQFFGVGAGRPGLVGVGLSYQPGEHIQAHAWFSADGRTWARAADPPAWSGPGDHVLDAACALPGGGIVALGATTVKGDQDVWAWVTADGAHWDQATGPGAALLGGTGTQNATACTTTAGGVLVAGSSGGHSLLWTTTDGLTWTTAGGPGTFAGGGHDGLSGVAVDGRRVVATGYDGDDLAVFTSPDGGTTWARRTATAFGGLGLQYGYPVVVGDYVVVAGGDGAGARVWVGPAP